MPLPQECLHLWVGNGYKNFHHPKATIDSSGNLNVDIIPISYSKKPDPELSYQNKITKMIFKEIYDISQTHEIIPIIMIQSKLNQDPTLRMLSRFKQDPFRWNQIQDLPLWNQLISQPILLQNSTLWHQVKTLLKFKQDPTLWDQVKAQSKSNQDPIVDYCKQTGFIFVDGSFYDRTNIKHTFYPMDSHPSELVHKRYAKILSDGLKLAIKGS